jgi:branched-chain amino acid transport system substrate-binding protein
MWLRSQRLLILSLISLVIVLAGSVLAGGRANATEQPPILIGLDAEFSHPTSTSAVAIERGIQLAIAEVNEAGGLLGGRRLALLASDNRAVAARSVANVEALAENPNVVALFCGRFSPVVVEAIPTVQRRQIPLLDPWAAADDIVDNGGSPNYVFRLSMRDSWAVAAMMRHANGLGLRRIGLLLPNTTWGRSTVTAVEAFVRDHKSVSVVGTEWYHWGDKTLLAQYRRLVEQGMELLVLTANQDEGSTLVREIAALPEAERRPIVSHWGIAGGDFVAMAGPALHQIDFKVVHPFSMAEADPRRFAPVAERARRLLGVDGLATMPSGVGFANAYDLTHILAKAITLAGTTDRRAVRDALERVPSYSGLVADYAPPFTATRHEALGPERVFVGRFRPDGSLVRVR